MARLLPGVCPHPCPTQSCPKDVAHCHCCWEVLASLPRVQPNTVPGQGSYTPNFSGLPDVHTCAYKEVHVRVCPNLLRAPFVPWELSIPRGWRTASTLSPHWAILVLTLACGRAALLIPHGSLHSQTLPSGSSFLPPPHLTPASGPCAETAYVLGNYKTEPCKKPPRLCRQGYACPYYHNSKDRRRSPRKHKYRSAVGAQGWEVGPSRGCPHDARRDAGRPRCRGQPE